MKSGIFKTLVYAGVTVLCASAKADAQNFDDIKYQRGSVIMMMIEHPMYMFNDEIAQAFRRIPVPDRFNDHGLGVTVVKFATQEYTDQQQYITSFIQQSNMGGRAVAKWFDWDKTTGHFDMDLIKERGLYNASAMERELAKMNIRGSAILEDAGENLIPNTYLIISDICYKGNYSYKERDRYRTGRNYRFNVNITSYIYQLNWDSAELDDFYISYYGGSTDFVNKASDYNFIFRAKVETDYGESANNITQSELIERVVARCLDINLVKLQRAYPDFRIKSVIASVNPVQSDIGLKEGVSEDCLFEVLEMSTDDNGITTFKRVGIVRPVKNRICDNRYGADITNELKYTEFEIIKGNGFYPGMLIREIENKRQ